ncbi:DUF7006 family protein [Enterococcus innesii]|uniref:DUF7006 family protein n=1 Tax=Enterococcus innesii TaxID=2839759 RepID=UPI00398477EC
MKPFTTVNEYKLFFENGIGTEQRKGLADYLDKQFYRLEYLIKMISPETFWAVFPEILGVDARINLLMELVAFEDFSNEEIIRIVESDYQYYHKELCGYDLKTRTQPSMMFTVR